MSEAEEIDEEVEALLKVLRIPELYSLPVIDRVDDTLLTMPRTSREAVRYREQGVVGGGGGTGVSISWA